MYGKGTVTNKQYKIDQKKTFYYAKKRCLLSGRPYLEAKEVEILNESDILKNIKKGIITGFGIKAVEHRELRSCSVLVLIFC